MEDLSNMLTTVSPTDGHSLSVVGDTYRVLISGKQTGGSYAVIDMLVPPGGGPGPHAHAKIQEAFYVIDGEIEVKYEAGKYTAKKGSFVNIPFGGMVHCFKNESDSQAHLLCMVMPAGLDEFFEEVGKPVAAGEFLPQPHLAPEDLKKLRALAEQHGQVLYPPDYLDK